jgi:hypothetical protein
MILLSRPVQTSQSLANIGNVSIGNYNSYVPLPKSHAYLKVSRNWRLNQKKAPSAAHKAGTRLIEREFMLPAIRWDLFT